MGELSGQFAICASQGTGIPDAPIRRMRAIYLDDLIKFPKPELEILFPRGASFGILSKEIRHGITYFIVELKRSESGAISQYR